MTNGPLAGRAVVVTRTRAQASVLVERLVGLGASVVELPVIAIEAPDDGGRALEGAIHRLVSGAYQWVVVTSTNAVARLMDQLGTRPVPPLVRWAAVGPGTAGALSGAGYAVSLAPSVSLAEGLVEEFPWAGAEGGTVLFPRAETVRAVVADGLRAKGWLVDEVIAYRTVPGDPTAASVAAAVRADAVAFTASSTVVRTVELLGADRLPPVIVTIGPVTSAAARSAGLEVTAEADPHSIEGLVAAVLAAFGGGGDGLP